MNNDIRQKYLILGYGDNPTTPGRFLADGLKAIGQPVQTFYNTIDFGQMDLSNCCGIIIVDCPSRPPIQLFNLAAAGHIIKFYWTYHGKHVLKRNIQLLKSYQINQVLMSSCLSLGKMFPVPVSFFPLAIPDSLFNGGPPIREREIDISFAGNTKGNLYAARKESLASIKSILADKKTVFTRGTYLYDLVTLYQNSKAVYNDSVNQTMTLRIFEGIGARSLVISDSLPEQDLILTPDKHYICYRNETEKIKKIRHYLNSPDEAQSIADNGFDWAMKHHTFSVRAVQLMNLLHKYC